MVPYPAAPRVVPQVELPFDIDANNTLNVCEQDKSNQTTITREKIEATRKFIEKHCFNMQNSLSEEKLKDKFTRCDKKIIEKAVRETLGWLNENQLAKLDDIETKMHLFEGVVNPILMKVYQAEKRDTRKRRRRYWVWAFEQEQAQEVLGDRCAEITEKKDDYKKS